MRKKKKPQYMLHSFGKLHSITDHKFSMPTGHLQFKATRIRKSMVVITLAADDLKIITNLYNRITLGHSSLLSPFLQGLLDVL